MKKVITIAALAVVMLFAGRATAQISIQAGYLTQEHNVNFSAQGQQLMQDQAAWMQGGFIGLTQNLPMFANIALAPGLYVSFSQLDDIRLVTTDGIAGTSDSSATASAISIKVPFFFNLKFGKFFDFGGPTFNVALSTLTNLQSIQNTSDLHYDMGAAVGAGVSFGPFRIYGGYNAGLIDRSKFDYSSSEAWTEAWEGSTVFAGIGLRL
jgi:hypothetical protein